MFQVLIVKPIFNLLVVIYALLPGHNFGLAIILFTLLVRLLMWPLVKKQMHQTKTMREMQPLLKKIKQAAKGNRQQEQLMMMELYKERGISPFSPIGTLILQLIILFGLYAGLSKVASDPSAILNNSYGWVQNLPWINTLASDISRFDSTLFGIVDLTKAAVGKSGGIYWPAMILVIGSAVIQFFTSRQLMPKDKDARKLRDILREAGEGKKADTSETNAAVGRSMQYFIPGFILIFTSGIPSALSLYWFFSGIVAYIQQDRALNLDTNDMEAIADAPNIKNSKKIIEGEVIARPVKTKNKTSKKSANKRKRRK